MRMRFWGYSSQRCFYNRAGAVWLAVSVEMSGDIMRHLLLVSAKERLGSPWVGSSEDPRKTRAGRNAEPSL